MPPLSKYFSLDEMVFSETATRFHLDNTPNAAQVFNLTRLCNEVLDPLRELIGKPIHVTSGYRCEEVNSRVGGAHNSQHIDGKAADIRVPGWTTEQLFQFVKHSGIKFDQLLQEYDAWVHISYSPDTGNRQMRLRVVKQDGQTKYFPD